MAYAIPQRVQEAAKRAVRWIEQGYAGDGFTQVGKVRARQLANGTPVSEDIIMRMKSYFARHQNDKQATGFNFGEDGFPSAGRVAWDAWGGDAGEQWVNRLTRLIRKQQGE